jgi:hypothetical protein
MGSQSDKTTFSKYVDLLNARSGYKRETTGAHLLTKTRANYFGAGTGKTEADLTKTAEIAREALRSIERELAQALAQITPEVQVPRLGEIILPYLCSPEVSEALLGDLDEGFRRRTTKRGVAAALWWYRWQIARSVVKFAANVLFRVVSILEALRKLGL